MMIMLLAGLQSLSREVLEAAEVDGATKWQRFWQVIFPLMLPVSVTAVMIRIIFKLKLADIIITVTAGGRAGRRIRSPASSTVNIGTARMSATARFWRSSIW